MALTPEVTQHMPVGQADQGQIVCLAAAEGGKAIGNAGAQIDGLCVGSKALTNAMFPDVFGTTLKAEFGL